VPAEALIKGMIVQSGNDAHRAGREDRRHEDGLQMMNEYAKRSREGHELQNSWGGLSPEHYTTARDLAVLARAIPRVPRILQMVFAARLHLERHQAGQPQRPPVPRQHRRRHENRAHRERKVLPGRVGQAQWHATDVRGAGFTLGEGARDASAALINYGFTFFETVLLLTGGKALLNPGRVRGATDTVAVDRRRRLRDHPRVRRQTRKPRWTAR
jgi:D-alanyl-D-alanine carboxypeptidase (penicillin-binding protein 5/6)